MPTAVEGLFVRVVGIKDGPRVAHRDCGALLSATFRILIPPAPVFSSHATIVTYSPVSFGVILNMKYSLDLLTLCVLSLLNVLLYMLVFFIHIFTLYSIY